MLGWVALLAVTAVPDLGTFADSVLLSCDPSALRVAEDGREVFFLGESRCGTDSTFNPLTVLVNNGLDILRSPSYTKPPGDVAWTAGFKNVFSNLAHPQRAIERTGGYRSFVAHEIFPFRGFLRHGQFAPNYLLHTLGEGMIYRKLTEWYAAEGIAAPELWGGVTLFSSLLINEVVENGDYIGPNWDPVADFYVFNLLGLVLFSFDEVARFFSGPVRINYWPGQAVLGVNGLIGNQGEDYVFKIWLGDWTRWRGFVNVGNRGLFGVSIPLEDGASLSMGAGFAVVGLLAEREGEGRIVVGEGRPNAELGIFYDVNESLRWSVRVGAFENPFVRVNVYPLRVAWLDASVGFFVNAAHYEGLSFGISLAPLPLGLGLVKAGAPGGPISRL